MTTNEQAAPVRPSAIASELTAAFDLAFDAVAIFTADESPVAARIVYVNAAHEKLSGYAREQLIGHSSVLLAGARPDLSHVREVENASPHETFFAVTRKYRPDGSVYVVDMRIAPLLDATGAPSHFILVQRSAARRGDDVSSASIDLLRTESAAIGRLAAGAAYELEAPLSRMLVNLRAVADALVADEAVDVERIRDALDAADRMRGTVRGLSAFTTLDDDPHGVDVHEALELAAHLAGHEINVRAQLRRHYSAIARVRGNIGRLTQVFLGLLRNAAASIPVSLPAANNIWIHTGLALDGKVTIDILDTGEGIEPDDLPFVFDPFFTTKPTSGSPGLGLAAARAAVVELGGTIAVESTVGRGSWFRITLPPVGEVASPTLPLFENESVATKSLLCVAESDADVQRLGELVDHDGAHVVFATVDDALVRLSLGEAYDLVVCEARAAARTSFREQVSRLAPESLGRTFLLTLRTSHSGTFLKPSARITGAAAEKRRTAGGR